MEKLLLYMERTLLPVTMRVVENRYMQAIRNAFIGSALPMIIVGSIFLILAIPPLPADLHAGVLGSVNEWLIEARPMLMIPFQFTFGLIALWVCYGVAESLAKHYKIDGGRIGLMAMATLLVFCLPVGVRENGHLVGLQALTLDRFLDNLGAIGLFVAILTGIGVAELNAFLLRRGFVIKMPPAVPPNVARSFEMMIPAFLAVGGAFLLEWWATTTFSPQPLDPNTALTMPQIVMAKLSFLVQASDTLPSAILQILLMMLLWVVGIHGMNVVSSVAYPLWQNNLGANIAALGVGEPATHIVSEPFFHMYAHLGGSGATLPLVFMLLRSKALQLKQVGRVALVPGLFNINEPIVFGVPIALNPLMAIPFLLAPTVIVTLNYLAMHTGLVPVATVQPPLTMPVLLGGFLADGSWRGMLLQGIDLVIASLIYYPFFKLYERRLLAEA
ncbi:PTS sugar transporter subunit IIC [Tumebacillus permanentifrigoris]|uniref:Permease IIC component n=1 Tax=Tumebacillus permanentifrigoris TaxID=378543 RepID=A0A316DDF0_9BACL|nr:PTS transporter subunit EIIC [Tumebacillus permanentifrigoris]PWK16034.1 PTS system cellobiose-specific IIC component [Tumebacillus permanentifrigoris]